MTSSILTSVSMAVGGAVVATLVLRRLRRALGNHMLRGMPRLQQARFVDGLRVAAFADPLGLVATLCGNNATAYLNHLWAQSKNEVKRAEMDIVRANPSAAQRFKPLTETEWPSEPLSAQSVPVVRMPTPERSNETIFVGIAVPTLENARGDPELARRNVRFFQLNKWSIGRDTDFIEHTTAGRTLTYNIGTEQTPQAFAAAIAEKIRARQHSK
jgi:hypothetical protein